MTELERVLLLVPLGLLAGAMTTLAGLGGGLMLLAAMSLLYDPHHALAVTAPALMLGNLHRTFLYRAELDREVAKAIAPAAFVASIGFGLLAVELSPLALRVLLTLATGLALLRATKILTLPIKRSFLVPMGLVIGAVTATSGGGPALLAPTLMAVGLRGERYVSTASLTALSMHVGRVFAYGVGGMFDRAALEHTVLVSVCVLAGNALGAKLRPKLSERAQTALELGAIVVVLGLALFGIRA